jgi:hypothetical protein
MGRTTKAQRKPNPHKQCEKPNSEIWMNGASQRMRHSIPKAD